ncbi:putative transcription factor interactor and regulator CCHC(Zn) family [Rosa chinensis]|uniref:Putative transcription factor interactor and regulator CCHC(Zn) family n=1 Tax=Rosa chinensis TaxID=74649 RepID=A0A2P6Q2V1_ROSCH|nr:uncharacterized protein LOC112165977 [Rosa chinensis]PRQ28496.1 putative transcription factor interactor and regulator CCHC(Zn) family [Rosa chinensis]
MIHIPERQAPAKRPESDQVPTKEQPEAKRPKLGDPQPEELAGDTPMGLQSDSKEDYHKGLSYCLICCKMVDHIILECPDLSKGSGIYCFVCEGPCKLCDDEHHRKNHFETIMFCDICGEQATHWSDNCSYGTDYRTARCEDAYGDSDIGCV